MVYSYYQPYYSYDPYYSDPYYDDYYYDGGPSFVIGGSWSRFR